MIVGKFENDSRWWSEDHYYKEYQLKINERRCDCKEESLVKKKPWVGRNLNETDLMEWKWEA